MSTTGIPITVTVPHTSRHIRGMNVAAISALEGCASFYFLDLGEVFTGLVSVRCTPGVYECVGEDGGTVVRVKLEGVKRESRAPPRHPPVPDPPVTPVAKPAQTYKPRFRSPFADFAAAN
jgi:hypothetical protein